MQTLAVLLAVLAVVLLAFAHPFSITCEIDGEQLRSLTSNLTRLTPWMGEPAGTLTTPTLRGSTFTMKLS